MCVNLTFTGPSPLCCHSAEVDGKNIAVQRGDQTTATHSARAECFRGALPARQSCNCSHVPQIFFLDGTGLDFDFDYCRDAITKVLQWPHAMVFPILDVLRLAATRSCMKCLNPVQFLFFGALTCLCHPLWRIFDIPI